MLRIAKSRRAYRRFNCGGRRGAALMVRARTFFFCAAVIFIQATGVRIAAADEDTVGPAAQLKSDAETTHSLTHVELKKEHAGRRTISGRILAEAGDGSLLLEERSGRMIQLQGPQVERAMRTDELWTPLSADEMAVELRRQTASTFSIYRTKNFVVCSDASERYTEYVGRLLQRVVEAYEEFFADLDPPLTPSTTQLPVIIFRDKATFAEFARAQHPNTDFTDVPGYYSVEHNQTLLTALPGDRQIRSNGELLRSLKNDLRHVETIVHETVHQLTFNTGLFVRYADNPTWLSEGLAVYFEPASGRGSLLWAGPGGVSRVHLPGFQAAARGDALRIPLSQICTSNTTFESTPQALADSYAESWALTYLLVRSRRPAFNQFVRTLSRLRPMDRYPANERISHLTEATGVSAEELEQDLIRYMKRVRVRR